MAICPICQSEIEIAPSHYGSLYSCPRCNGVFFVDWSGQPEVEGFQAPPSEEASPGEGSLPEAPFSSSSEEDLPPPMDFALPPLSMDPSQGLDPLEPSSIADSADLSDIVDFGNAEASLSALNYTLVLKGIDSAALRKQIEEVLSDAKFGWNAAQLMSQMKDGVLTIRSLNPVKASILIQRVKYLPVHVSWRQDVLSSPE